MDHPGRRLPRLFLRGISYFLAILGLAACLVYWGRHPILRGVSRALTHQDTLARSDVIVVLSGDETTRPFKAAELYRKGFAPLVAVPNEQLTPTAELGLARSATDIVLEILQDSGVPESSIVLLSEAAPVTSTRDEARVIQAFVEQSESSSIIVVTSIFHTARARYTLRKRIPAAVELRMAASDEWRYDPAHWWESEAGITDYGMEVLKWIHTLGVLN